jgi:hypothetical protein
VQSVLAAFPSGTLPSTSYEEATRAAALEAAMVIERGFFSEQTDDTGTTAYPSLKAARDLAFAQMVNAANSRALFNERTPA